jgi:hypothetical protein
MSQDSHVAVWCMIRAACCRLHVACCMLRAACPYAVWCMLHVALARSAPTTAGELSRFSTSSLPAALVYPTKQYAPLQCNTHDATCNVQHAIYTIRHATCNMRHTAYTCILGVATCCTLGVATCCMKHATYICMLGVAWVLRVACCMLRAACCVLHARVAQEVQRARIAVGLGDGTRRLLQPRVDRQRVCLACVDAPPLLRRVAAQSAQSKATLC